VTEPHAVPLVGTPNVDLSEDIVARMNFLRVALQE